MPAERSICMETAPEYIEKTKRLGGKKMRHIYIRGIIGLIWLVAAIVCGVSGSFPMMGLYLVLAGVFLYSAYAAWKKEKDGKGGR